VAALNDGPPILATRGGRFSTGIDVSGSWFDALSGLYLPEEGLPSWLPASQRYVHDQIWTGPMGSASASKRNGKLTSIQSVNTRVASESFWAGV